MSKKSGDSSKSAAPNTRRREMHDVEALQLRIEGNEHRRDDREIFGDVIGDREGREGAPRHEELLADLDDLDELGRVAVEIGTSPSRSVRREGFPETPLPLNAPRRVADTRRRLRRLYRAKRPGRWVAIQLGLA
jgi:hypothetical protein